MVRNDEVLSREIAAFEYGEDPEEFYANTLPTIYVTLASAPEVSRDNLAPANPSPNTPNTEDYIRILDSHIGRRTHSRGITSQIVWLEGCRGINPREEHTAKRFRR